MLVRWAGGFGESTGASEKLPAPVRWTTTFAIFCVILSCGFPIYTVIIHEYSYCFYLSLDALSSKTASLNADPSSVLAKHRMLVVLPVPGGPCEQKEQYLENTVLSSYRSMYNLYSILFENIILVTLVDYFNKSTEFNLNLCKYM